MGPVPMNTQNVIFDLAGVVVSWDPRAFLRRVSSDPEERAKVRTGLLEHADWVELDRGTLTRDEAVRRAAVRTGLPPATVGRYLDRLPGELVPIPATVELLHDLKRAGQRLFCLSNMHHAAIDHLEAAYDFWDVFDGRVISCRVRMVKPDPAIFHHLLETFRLDVATTVFVDDMAENVEAAERVGLRTVLFESPAQCRSELAST